MDYLFPKGENSSIPLVSITGTNGKTTTTRMIAHIQSLKGLCVGMTTTSGVYINGRCVSKGDNTGPDSARIVLMDKSVDAAVLETARGGIVKRGLGYDLADVGVISNISDDHLGLDGVETIEDLAFVKCLVAEAVKDYGYVVLNADDPTVNIINQRVKSNIIYFTKNPDNIIVKKHLLDGGLAVFEKDNFIYMADGERTQPVVCIGDIPSSMDGKLGYNVENAMAAAAACIGLKEDIELIARGLKTFYMDDSQNPGRFNLHSINNFKVVVDYGHNIGGYTAVIESLKKLGANRLVGVIGVPGDRKDENIIELGKISGMNFSRIYIKEDMDKRGRGECEVASLLEQGLLSAGRSQQDYKIVLDETHALREAMECAEEGDCIIIFYEDYDRVMAEINDFKNSCQRVEIQAGAV
jgi:cyanophycin synthetase